MKICLLHLCHPLLLLWNTLYVIKAQPNEISIGFHSNMLDGLRLNPSSQFDEYANYLSAALNMTVIPQLLTGGEDTSSFDFLIAPPAVPVCAELGLKASYDYQTIFYATNRVVANQVQTLIDGAGHASSFSKVCGAIIARRDMPSSRDLRTIVDSIVAMVHPLDIGGGQLQLAYLQEQYDIELMADQLMVMVSHFSIEAVVMAVFQGQAQFGFVPMDALDNLVSQNILTPEQRNLLIVVDGREVPGYPFYCTTTFAPSWVLMANYDTRETLSQRVLDALLRVTPTDPPAIAAGSITWTLPIGNAQVSLMMSQLRQLGNDYSARCPPMNDLYGFVGCPDTHDGQTYFKLDRSAFNESCYNLGLICPDGFECMCSPCRTVPLERYPVYVVQNISAVGDYDFPLMRTKVLNDSGVEKLIDTLSGGLTPGAAIRNNFWEKFSKCSELSSCASVKINSTIGLALFDIAEDYLNVLGWNVTSKVEASAVSTTLTPSWITVARNDTLEAYYVQVTFQGIGTYLVRIRANGKEVTNSPTFIQVEPLDCATGWLPDGNGGCIQVVIGVPSKNTDDSPTIALSSIIVILVIAVIVLVVGFVSSCCCYHRRDAKRWAIKESDLSVDEATLSKAGIMTALLGGSTKVRLVPLTVKRLMTGTTEGGGFFSGLRSANKTGSIGSTPVHSIVEEKRSTTPKLTNGSSDSGQVSPSPPFQRTDSTFQTNASPSLTQHSITAIAKVCRNGRHPNLAILHGYTWLTSKTDSGTVTDLALVEEYSEFGTLEDLLDNKATVLELDELLKIAKDVANGLSFLHTMRDPMPHGNLRASAVLINERLTAKVAWRGNPVTTPTQTLKPRRWRKSFQNSRGSEGIASLEEDTPPANPYRRSRTGRQVDSGRLTPLKPTFAKDLADYASKILLRMFFPARHVELKLVAEKSHADFCSTINRSDVPIRIRNLLIDCLDPIVDNRPTFDEVTRCLDKAIESERQLNAGKKKGEIDANLIMKLFPRDIALALRAGRKPEPQYHPELTILFSDVCGFTDISSKLDARDVQRTLNAMFQDFDHLVEEHGLFRMEIIGDAYVIVGNLTSKHPDHTARVCRMGVDMIRTAAKHRFKKRVSSAGAEDLENGCESYDVNIRVGIHVGPAVGTVLGNDRPRFTLLGDTVNTASRMESNGKPMHVHLSGAAGDALRQQDPDLGAYLHSRGEMHIKGKGVMNTLFLRSPSLDSSPRYQLDTSAPIVLGAVSFSLGIVSLRADNYGSQNTLTDQPSPLKRQSSKYLQAVKIPEAVGVPISEQDTNMSFAPNVAGGAPGLLSGRTSETPAPSPHGPRIQTSAVSFRNPPGFDSP